MKIQEMGQRIMGRVEDLLNLKEAKASAEKARITAESKKAAAAAKAQQDAELKELSEAARADIEDLNTEAAAIKAEYDALEAKLKATKAEYLADMKRLGELYRTGTSLWGRMRAASKMVIGAIPAFIAINSDMLNTSHDPATSAYLGGKQTMEAFTGRG